MKRAKSVDDYIASSEQWQNELRTLRKILQSTELEEGIKWGGPCYMIDGRNVVGLGAFKSYFGLWFHQGALLEDKSGKLINAQEGKTRALRQWRMHDARDIKPTIIRRYLKEAIANARAGKEIKANRNRSLALPPELKKALQANKKAAAAFKKLLPGKQKEYAGHICEARRDDTKLRRVDKIIPMIIAGVGLNDKYR